ncbi:MAG: thioredoxin domain-containing protein [Candidatus Binatia bacterium]
MRGPLDLVIGLAILAVACGRGADEPGTPAPEAAPQVRTEPSAAPADDVVRKRIVDYYEKTVTTPGLSFKVTRLEASDVPGWRRGTLEASLGQQSQPIGFYVSQDGRFLFRGDAVDLTIDPLAAIMAKIRLDGRPSRGPADAKVTIVEYADFQCPFCSRVYATVEEQVLKTYADRVRFVFKHFPLTSIHPWAEDAALAGACAFEQGNDHFWTVYRGLFSRQGEITKDNLRDRLLEIAQSGGLDGGRLRDCLDGRKAMAAVKADEEEAATVGVTSTPTFFINGRKLSGAQAFDAFKQVIDQELGAQPHVPSHGP